MQLFLYNSLTRKKELFTPINPENVGMYVCGPTVYDRAHLGNGRPVVVFDVLYRLLKNIYPKVTYVRNITDVDDKINAASLAKGISIKELTTTTTAWYHQDMQALMALNPDNEPRATDHIQQMIEMIKTLIEKDFAYANQGHVLFRIQSYTAYGSLARRNQDEMLAGARVEVAPYKENAGDFVLWKPSEETQPGWESPWGRGRPGWHIECSAMSKTYLGETFDIHGGGIDLIFPHHENEVAQSVCAHGGKAMANYWMHNGHLTVSGSKMSKSLGNFFTVTQLLENHKGEVIRLALLMTHYRQPLDWSDDVLAQAKGTLDRWYAALQDVPCPADNDAASDSPADNDAASDSPADTDCLVYKALLDDLNTPQAIAELHGMVNALIKAKPSEKADMLTKVRKAAYLLGLLQQDPLAWSQSCPKPQITKEEIENMIVERKNARANKDFAGADNIRNILLERGVALEDKPTGTFWRYT